MDYILKKFEASINLADDKDKSEYMRARIEYLIYFLLGYVWNKYKKDIDVSDMLQFSQKLGGSLTLGKIIRYIKNFDENSVVSSTDTLTEYNKYRINNIGHGFSFNADTKEENLDVLYKNLCNDISMLNQNTKNDIIVIEKKHGNRCKGYRIGSDKMFPELWEASEDMLPEIEKFPAVLFSSDNSEYNIISPFIHIERIRPTDMNFYIFFQTTSSNESAEFTNLFETSEKKTFSIPNIYRSDGFQKISGNGTIINKFKNNYTKYIDVGMLEKVKNFLKNNNAAVAIISGNGGIGKTACVQKICDDLFSSKSKDKKDFGYIIFASAKDRKFNPENERIEVIENSLKDFYGVMNTIYRTIKNEDINFASDSQLELNKFIKSITDDWDKEKKGRILFIIDDYETFNDENKKRIIDFLEKLDINKHKAIITTRNSNLITSGTQITNDPLDEERTVEFVRNKIDEINHNHIVYFEDEIKKDENRKRLYAVTEGVPLFMIQWVHIFLRDHEKAFLDVPLSSKEEAREFRVGRIYSYLSGNAKILYAALSVVKDTARRFNKDTLCKCCVISIDVDSFERSFDELVHMNIIESQNDNVYRIYNEVYLSNMEKNFNLLDESTRNSILGKFNQTYDRRSTDVPEVALFKGAEDADKRADYQTAADKYRQLIKDDQISLEIRCKAMVNLFIRMGTTADAETLKATFEEYDKKYQELTTSLTVIHQYIYSMWAKDNRVAYELIKGYLKQFDEPNSENLSLLALCATFYAMYILQYNKNNTKKLEDAFFWCNKIYLFVFSMSNDEFGRYITSQTKQNVETCLIQAFDISIELSKRNNIYKDAVSDIANFFCNKFPTDETNLKHFSVFRVYCFNMLKIIKNPSNDKIKAFKGKIKKIGNTDAILHISKCAQRLISQEEMEKLHVYLQKNTVNVKIIREDERGYEVSLIDVKPSFDDIVNNNLN